MNDVRVICIAGGSGAGKSTLADGLAARFGERASVLRLDDYQKPREEVPMTPEGLYNYDCPDAVAFDRFIADLDALRSGRDAVVTRRKKRLTMDAGVADGGTTVVKSRPIVIVEGYLALWHPAAAARYDFAIFLEAARDLRVARRRWAKDPSYVERVLLPMHDLYIEPTKRSADLVIGIDGLTPAEVLDRALAAIGP